MPKLLMHNSARVLEFDALRELLRGYASSPLGQARIAALAPTIDSEWIAEQHELTEEVREFRRVGGRFEFSGLLDVKESVEKSRITGVARDCTASPREYADGLAANSNAVGKCAGLHRIPAKFSQQDSAGWNAGRPRIARIVTDSP